jgi:hypothetical protein
MRAAIRSMSQTPASASRSGAGPARSVELTIVVADEIRPWRYPPRCDLQYGEWLRAGYDQGDVAAAEEHTATVAALCASLPRRERVRLLGGLLLPLHSACGAGGGGGSLARGGSGG